MSRSNQEKILCPSCGEGQLFTIWDSINVSIDPDLKTQLLKGELATMRCRNCEEETHVEYDCLYHDMDRFLALWLKYPGDDVTAQIDPAMGGNFPDLTTKYVCRLIPSFHELLDKICIFDDGFTDHSIELLKLIISFREKIDVSCPLHYVGIKKFLLKGKSLLFALDTGDGFVEIRYPVEKYLENILPLMQRIMPAIDATTEEWPHVDRNYMLRALEVCGLIKEMDNLS